MAPVKLSWSAAEVTDARLTVALEGEVPKGWKQSFERTVTLLGDGEWGEVQLKKGSVQVSDVPPGSEDKLRHHLEAIVAQANAAIEEDDRDEDGGGEERKGPDAEMTERFRAFAEDDDDGAAEKGD
ncbi:MAG TPA: hypothetical protein VFH80_03905 [Solirubrobacteraceae bacterium]|nr:hypothetical protein [Solirubrobacteraceae bacterium]